MTNNKFSKTQSRVLCYGKARDYCVVDCNCLEAVAEAIDTWGKPDLYMDNFNTWQELARARKCYEWQLSAIPGAKKFFDEKPSPEDMEWFWQKQLDDEHFVKDIKEINKWVEHLPDDPNAYSYTKERNLQ